MNQLRVYYPPAFPAVAYNCTRYPTFNPTFNCYYNGFMVEILKALAETANFTIIPYAPKNVDHDNYMIEAQEMMKNGSIDVIARTFAKTNYRVENFDFSDPLYIMDNYVVRLKKTYRFAEMFSFYRSYDSKIWLAIFLVWFMQLICCILCRQLNHRTNSEKKFPSVFEEAWRVLRLQLLQHRELEHDQNASTKFSTSVFAFFQCYLLLSLFSSLILASILRPHVVKENAIQFVINAINDGRYKFAVTSTNYWLFEKIESVREFPYDDLKQALAKNPVKVVKTIDELFDSILSDESITILQNDEHAFYLLQNYCDFEILNDEMPVASVHIMLPKGQSVLKRKINEAMNVNRFKINAILHKYSLLFNKYPKCLPSESNRFKPLKIYPYFGTLILCFGLVFIAFLVFTIEVLYRKFDGALEEEFEKLYV